MGMKWIVITSPDYLSGEESVIARLLDGGVDVVHIRKPSGDIVKYRRLLDALPRKYHKRIVLHEHFELFRDYDILGIHLNRRCKDIPKGFCGQVSCSCHSFGELQNISTLIDYAFLSPIFNSISKQGYNANFTDEELCAAAEKGVINSKVIALGGVEKRNIDLLKRYHFGGFAMLGDIWQRTNDNDFNEYLKEIRNCAERETQ